jgi:hypothetical protein
MKTILRMLVNGEPVKVGRWELIRYDDGTVSARCDSNGLMAPGQSGTPAGLTRLLCWIDAEEATPNPNPNAGVVNLPLGNAWT